VVSAVPVIDSAVASISVAAAERESTTPFTLSSNFRASAIMSSRRRSCAATRSASLSRRSVSAAARLSRRAAR
jgi:hypothetical protein